MKKIYETPSVSVAKLEELGVILTSNDAGKPSIPKGEWTN